jgi:hypothetical protein
MANSRMRLWFSTRFRGFWLLRDFFLWDDLSCHDVFLIPFRFHSFDEQKGSRYRSKHSLVRCR